LLLLEQKYAIFQFNRKTKSQRSKIPSSLQIAKSLLLLFSWLLLLLPLAI